MSARATSPAPTVHRIREIAANFAGRTSTKMESAMRAHLPTCASCRRRYERMLILDRLDPRARPARERIGRGLGLWRSQTPNAAPVVAVQRGRWRTSLTLGGIASAAALAAVMVLTNKAAVDSGGRSAARYPGEFAPRGPVHANLPSGSDFWTYRIGRGGVPALVQGRFAAQDELAFAYSNPAGAPYLMIFGVDEHRHVYWFHPAWPAGAPGPSAVPATAGPGPHELQDAIRHNFDGGSLAVYALHARQPLQAEFIEARVRTARDPLGSALFGSGVTWTRRWYEVTR